MAIASRGTSRRSCRAVRPLFAVALAAAIVAAPGTSPAEECPLRIDVPVKLARGDVVFNMAHVALQGDLPVGMKYMRLVARRLRETGVTGHLVAVFHSDAGYMTLSDRAYDAYRNVSTGNPYKALLAELAADGVQIEECAATMRDHRWTNDDLLPFVKVNAGAISRMIELAQRGYVQITP